MKLVVPIVSVEDVEPLVKAGADEFYCGIYTEEFLNDINFAICNKRPALRMNFKSFDDLRHAISAAHKKGTKVFLTVNSLGYIGEHYVWLERILRESARSGIDGFIVSDIGMIQFIKSLNLDCAIQISTTAVTYNSEAVQFFKKMGASRIIFPRHISLNEMLNTAEKEHDIQYEIFMLNSRCPNEDGLCTIEHALNYKTNTHGCFFNRNFRIHSENPGEIKYEGFATFIQNACGACLIPVLINSNIQYLKIVGREKPLRSRVKDSIFLKRIINHIESDDIKGFSNPIDYIQNFYKEFYKENCNGNCYYPITNKYK